jgi:hypothetical protein
MKPETILALIRGHWSIGCVVSRRQVCSPRVYLHFVKDRWRDEDRHVLSMRGLGERFTCMLNRAVGVLGLLKRGKEPLTAVAAWARDKPKECLKLLGFCEK